MVASGPDHLPAEAGEAPLLPVRCMRMLAGIARFANVQTNSLIALSQECDQVCTFGNGFEVTQG